MSPLGSSGTDPSILRRVADEIRKKKELEQSLGIAQRRQRFMLPSSPVVEGYEFACTFDSAADISGDFYDFIPLADGRLGILIADVSGHGVEAAIVMGMAKKSLSIFAKASTGAAETLVRGNADLCADLDSDTFLTAVYAVLDAESGRLTFARAGHPLVVLFNPKSKPAFREIKSGGMMLGMTASPIFERSLSEETVELVPGDLVFLYTDGLTEARSPSGEQFGLDRLAAILASKPRASTEKLLEAVRAAVNEFQGGREAEDDITMIAFRRI